MTRQSTFSEQDGVLYINHVEDVEPLLDENAEERNSGNNGFSKSRNWRKIGSIPLIIVEKVLREKGINLMEDSPEARKYCREFLQKNSKLMTVDKL